MSNINDEQKIDNLKDMLTFAMTQFIKGLWLGCPGIIETYNPNTKRAQVRPALRMVMTDNSENQHPIINNVPVMFPSGGGFTFIIPLKKGDPVWLDFSQRGMTEFKLSYEEATPDKTGLFSIKDCVIRAGFGAGEITPATVNGASLQTEDGANNIYVEDGKINIETSGTVHVTAQSAIINADTTTFNSNVNINGDLATSGTHTLDGVVVNGHDHSGVVTGGDNTDPMQ